MTREEAREVIKELWKRPKSENGNTDFYIELFVKFGALKLDEAPPVSQRAWAALNDLTKSHVAPIDIEKALALYGLKVVEK